MLGLIVSGNAGPTFAAKEQGLGANAAECLGRECSSVSQMSLQDWKKFYIASSGKESAQELENVPPMWRVNDWSFASSYDLTKPQLQARIEKTQTNCSHAFEGHSGWSGPT